ncbi:TPA: hypothetical protein N0F65_005868 [Lagenidium giganteum]|uniref:Calponin-homology (CH) domain-containing protein n=1 Tax=Lagenidium giganteum TaxID=4803 RepID=A0AAV2YLR6_9STRA|nr:TPA: hypothetical protein N0F65_005868 [Lagenidium giganteum]
MNGLYEWVDSFSFSRPKKNIARDFSDAVLLAELIAQLFPTWVHLHNYPSTHKFQQKIVNWETLNRKVLTRIKCDISRKHQEDLANAVPGAVELLLIQVKKKTTLNTNSRGRSRARPNSTNESKYTLVDYLPSPKDRPDQDCIVPKFTLAASPKGCPDQDSIASSFSRILQLMSDKEKEFESATLKISHKKLTTDSTKSCLKQQEPTTSRSTRPLTPEFKSSKADVAKRTRSLSADARARSYTTMPLSTPTRHKIEQLIRCKLPEPAQEAKQTQEKNPEVTKQEFQESSFVYFSCCDGEAVACDSIGSGRTERVQVARVVKALPSGDCLVQLFKLVPSDGTDVDAPRSYLSTPHFIECCGAQLNNIHHMLYDDLSGEWKWFFAHKQLPNVLNRQHSPEQKNMLTQRIQSKVPTTRFQRSSPRVPPKSVRFFTCVLSKRRYRSLAFDGVDAQQENSSNFQDTDAWIQCSPFVEESRIDQPEITASSSAY